MPILINKPIMQLIYDSVNENCKLFKIPDLYLDNNNGFYTGNSMWNSLIDYKGKKYRHRVEAIVFNKKNEIFAYINKKGIIKLPGGSTEKDTTNETQLFNEIQEEARINVDDIKFTKITYIKTFDKIPDYMKDFPIKYDGYYTEVYTAKYVSKFNGPILKDDQDINMTTKGKFYTVDELLTNGSSFTINTYYKTLV